MAAVTSTAAHAAADDLMNGFRLGPFSVFPNQRLIVAADGTEQSMEDRVIMVLLALARRPHEVVSQNDFMETVWADTVVEPSVLSRAIALLRAALGDNARDPTYIKTYHRRGYELIVDVSPLPRAEEQRASRLRPALAAAALAAAAILAALWAFWPSADGPPKIAVIPFSAPDSPSLPAGGELIADYLIGALAQSSEIAVAARHDSFAIPGTTMNVGDIGDALAADYLVGGSVRLSGENVVLTLTLTDTAGAADVWSQVLRGSPDDQVGLQRRALAALSDALGREIGLAPLTPGDRIDDQAYRRYLQAQHQWNLRGSLRIARAIELLREAIEIRPDFAEAHLALAQALATQPFYTDEPMAAGFVAARAALEQAEVLDPELRSQVAALRGLMHTEEKRWADAERELTRALAADPDNALAHYWYSTLLSNFGRFDEALVEVQRAAELNPYSAFINDRLALAYLWVGDIEGAARHYRIATDLGYLDSTQVKPAVLYAVLTENWDGIRELLVRVGNDPGWVEAFVRGLRNPTERDEASRTIEAAMRRGEIPRQFWFGIWVLFADADRAIRDFDPGEKTQDIELLWARQSAFLRADPRFPTLVAAVGLEDYVDLSPAGGPPPVTPRSGSE